MRCQERLKTYLVNGRFGISLPKPLYELRWWLHDCQSADSARTEVGPLRLSVSEFIAVLCNWLAEPQRPVPPMPSRLQ